MPTALAEFVAEVATNEDIQEIYLDGPQGWQGLGNPHNKSRYCEFEAKTPGGMGLPGICRPAPYLKFLSFCVKVFDNLDALGFPRYDGKSERFAAEVFPFRSWKTLGLSHLSARDRRDPPEVEKRFTELRLFGQEVDGPIPTHDELQAIVGGCVGFSLGEAIRYGVAPYIEEGIWREGFILAPGPNVGVQK